MPPDDHINLGGRSFSHGAWRRRARDTTLSVEERVYEETSPSW